jgi:hypothetical protein
MPKRAAIYRRHRVIPAGSDPPAPASSTPGVAVRPRLPVHWVKRPKPVTERKLSEDCTPGMDDGRALAGIIARSRAYRNSDQRKWLEDFYNNKRWRRLRAAYFYANPLCEECERNGLLVAARQVHHKITMWEAPDLGYDWDNLEALCISCHNRKREPIAKCEDGEYEIEPFTKCQDTLDEMEPVDDVEC